MQQLELSDSYKYTVSKKVVQINKEANIVFYRDSKAFNRVILLGYTT